MTPRQTIGVPQGGGVSQGVLYDSQLFIAIWIRVKSSLALSWHMLSLRPFERPHKSFFHPKWSRSHCCFRCKNGLIISFTLVNCRGQHVAPILDLLLTIVHVVFILFVAVLILDAVVLILRAPECCNPQPSCCRTFPSYCSWY
jgi:hypothetical protein